MSNSQKRKRDSSDIIEWTDFEELARRYPDFDKAWRDVKAKQSSGNKSSFASCVTQEFNIALTRSLLQAHFGLVLPSLPPDRLCPPVPNRYAYVQWLQHDLLPLLCSDNEYFETTQPLLYSGLDVGTGSSCIYPLLFVVSSVDKQWNMLGTEIDSTSADSARTNVRANELDNQIRVVDITRQQVTVSQATGGGPIACAAALAGDEPFTFDFCMTNPPFFDSTPSCRADDRDRTPMTEYEGTYPGGEVGFISDMIRDSLRLRDGIGWYSTMCGKKSSFVQLKSILTHLLGPGHVQTTEYSPGYMTRWFLAWTFQRPKIQSPAARVSGGKHDFVVKIEDEDPLDEVVKRIQTYCETLPGWDLSTSMTRKDSARVVQITEKSTPSLWHQVDESDTLPERIFDGIERDWDANDFLPKEGHFMVEVTLTKDQQDDTTSASPVSVHLESYRHSSRGGRAVEKIQSQLQGEICRSNRRWRRILKRQAEQGRDASNGPEQAPHST